MAALSGGYSLTLRTAVTNVRKKVGSSASASTASLRDASRASGSSVRFHSRHASKNDHEWLFDFAGPFQSLTVIENPSIR